MMRAPEKAGVLGLSLITNGKIGRSLLNALNKAMLALCLEISVLCAGCAGTAPKATFTRNLAVDQRLHAADTPEIKITASDGVFMLDVEKERLLQQVQSGVKTLQALNTGTVEPRSLRVDITMTRYEKGNAFARAMIAGLGQMHIDANVAVYQMPDNTSLTEFKVAKTFAWGGIYGTATHIEDIEKAFAHGVAVALTGQEDKNDKNKPSKT